MIEATQIHLQQQEQTNFKSEATLVRLALNALQGIQSSLLTIQTLTEAFRSDPADRTFHSIPSLWSRSSSTQCIGKLLNSFALSGSLVYMLHNFVHFHLNPPFSLVNQAFAVAVRKVLEGYVSALDTLCASVEVRRSSLSLSGIGAGGCLTSVVVQSEVTILEVYLHTKELRIKIHALASICKINGWISGTSFEEMTDKATLEFVNFPRGGDLLTYLYTQLEFSDPAQRAVLKFLFLRSCEPYCRFIREWIYEANISDPCKEFIVEYAANNIQHGNDKDSMHFGMATIREDKDRVAVPCFLQHHLISILRAGQQLQVLIKLRELCRFSDSGRAFEDVIPCWSGTSSYHPTYASLLTFNKVKIESIVSARSRFYSTMDEKLENSFTKLEIRYPQVVRHAPSSVSIGTLGSQASSTLIEDSISSFVKKRRWDVNTGNVESDDSTSDIELVDQLESSECSSASSFEDEHVPLIEDRSFDKRIQVPLSALRLSSSVSINGDMQMPPESNESKAPDILHEIDRTDPFAQFSLYDCNQGIYLSHFSALLEAKKQKKYYMHGSTFSDYCDDMDFLPCGFVKTVFCNDREYFTPARLHPSKSNLKIRNQILAVLKEESSSNLTARANYVADLAPDSGPLKNEVNAPSRGINMQSWMLRQNRNFLSVNPMLSKHSLLHLMSKPDNNGRGCKPKKDLLSCFDFSTVEDPFKLSMEDVDFGPGRDIGVKLPLLKEAYSSDSTCIGYSSNKLQCDEIDTSLAECKGIDIPPMVLQHQDENSGDISGGRCWETMLAGSVCTVNDGIGDIMRRSNTMFETPLNFIIDKCLLQEIKFQYVYISKLTIKLLEEGFDLHEHLMALRRYHFMEVADWADLFITSLWHHKVYITGADKRISRIQGLLELSAQRSSCEKDHNKDRLFVFIKGQGTPLSTSAVGVHSFDFIGLGYRVDWPVSIILTSAALEKYADIFSFLVRVKLAVIALTDAWCSLKDLLHLTSANHTKLHEMEVHQINFLMKIRHLVNHFVCTLQQYVLSQLSHVSWCKFLHSLKDMVKDMMDFELVHMTYLSESQQICFLSAETQSAAKAIENILQCALDFQSCLVKGTWKVSQDQSDCSGLLSHINTNKVHAIKKRFDRELKELYICYLKSPKHGDFGLFRFWEYLNYNEYYSNTISSELGQLQYYQ